MGNQSSTRELMDKAVAAHYVGMPEAPNPREACEAEESTTEVVIDECAAKLRACGCAPREALRYVQAIMGVLRAKDAALVADFGALDERGAAGESVSEVLVRYEATTCEMLRGIIAAGQPKLEAKVNLMARGKSCDEETQRKLAASYGISPAAVSKMMRERQARFNLPDNQHNKSAAACERYRMGNKRRASDHAA